MAKILLLGGTGAMGMHLVQLLTNTEHHVVVTSRRSRQDHDNIHTSWEMLTMTSF